MEFIKRPTDYDYFNDPKYPLLRIVVDSYSFEQELDSGNSDVARILEYNTCPAFEFLRSPKDSPATALRSINAFEFNGGEDRSTGTIKFATGDKDKRSSVICAFGYRKVDIESLIDRLTKSKADESVSHSLTCVFWASALQDALGRAHKKSFVLATNNEVVLKNKPWLESNFEIKILSIPEALKFMDLAAKSRNLYFASPHHQLSRWRWYLYFAKNTIPNYQLPWSMSVHGKGTLPEAAKLGSYLAALLDRTENVARAVDEVGFEFYNGATNDAQDGMIYHLSYLILLVTGIFDSLAWVSYFRYSETTPRPNLITIRISRDIGRNFRRILEEHNPSLLQWLDENIELVELFYPLREQVQHRDQLQAVAFMKRGGEESWDRNLIRLREDELGHISAIDQANPYSSFSSWGVYNSGEDHFLEPYQFAQKVQKEIFAFVDEYFRKLDFAEYLSHYPGLNEKIKANWQGSSWKRFETDLANFRNLCLKPEGLL